MLALGLGIGITLNAGGGVPEALAFFRALTVQPTTKRRSRYIAVVNALKLAGLFTAFDALLLHGGQDEQAGRVNLVNPSNVWTAVNSPAFAASAGFTGDGATSFLSTGLVANVLAKFTQDSAYLGSWSLSDVATNTGSDIGVIGSYLNPRATAGNLVARANFSSGSAQTVTNANSIGLHAWNRKVSTDFDMCKNGAVVGNKVIASGAISAATFTALKVDANFSPRQIAVSAIGRGLTDAEHVAFYNILNTIWFPNLGSD